MKVCEMVYKCYDRISIMSVVGMMHRGVNPHYAFISDYNEAMALMRKGIVRAAKYAMGIRDDSTYAEINIELPGFNSYEYRTHESNKPHMVDID